MCVAEMGLKSQMNIYQDKKDKYKVGGRRHLQKWGRTENVYCGISEKLFTSIAIFCQFQSTNIYYNIALTNLSNKLKPFKLNFLSTKTIFYYHLTNLIFY